MKRQIVFLTFSFLFMSVLSKAQSNCPEGFVYIGNLSGTGSATQEFNRRWFLNSLKTQRLMSPINKAELGQQMQKASQSAPAGHTKRHSHHPAWSKRS
jgi:hypothetical protein